MNNAEYEPYWLAFKEEGAPVMDQVRAAVQQLFPELRFTPVYVVDHDVDRGLGFCAENPPNPEEMESVEMLLVDGGEYGYEGVGLKMDCSAWLTGMVWAPYNWSEQVGTTDVVELRNRIRALPVDQAASYIAQEWLRIREQALATTDQPERQGV